MGIDEREAAMTDTTALDVTLASVVRGKGDLAAVEFDGELVLYDEHTASVHHLNPTASVVWQCLDGDASLAAIARDLSMAYSVDEAVVVQDVLDVVQQFARMGLLEVGAPGHDDSAPAQTNPLQDDDTEEGVRYVPTPPSG